MTVQEIIKQYLIDNHFDGLCNDDCGCGLDDLMPCCGNGIISDCKPAYEILCKCVDSDNCELSHHYSTSKKIKCYYEN